MTVAKKKYKCGLVLSGGAVRGFAHAGALKALNEEGIFPDVISGVSAGTIVGSLYADGYTPEQIYKIFVDKRLYKFLEFILPNKGLVKMTGLYKTMMDSLKAKYFEDLKIPLYVTVTDLNNAKTVYFSKGELTKMIIASCTIPILFTPMVIDDVTYIDGGVLNNFPTEPIEHECEMMVGININPIRFQKEFSGMTQVADRAVHMMIDQLIAPKKAKCKIYIEPDGLEKHALLNIAKGKEMYNLGYKAAKKAIKEQG
jgi:NTE family protein